MKHFNEDGLTFEYPAEWKVDLDRASDGWTATLQSPGTAFAVVRLDRSLPEPEAMLGATLEALQAEYPDVEAEPALETISGDLAAGHDIDFFSMDLPTACWTRSFYGAAGTVLVLCQVSDLDREVYEPALRALTRSMRTEE